MTSNPVFQSMLNQDITY